MTSKGQGLHISTNTANPTISRTPIWVEKSKQPKQVKN